MSTLKNLCTAFAGESQARNRYTIFAKIAREEKLDVVADLFTLTATQEATHARLLWEMIQTIKGEEHAPIINIDVPIDFGKTADNLRAAIAGETFEFTEMYPNFAKAAEEEGHKQIAAKLRLIAAAEKGHAEKYESALKALQENKLYAKETKTYWVCKECGYIICAEKAPAKCPLCGEPGDYFRVLVQF